MFKAAFIDFFWPLGGSRKMMPLPPYKVVTLNVFQLFTHRHGATLAFIKSHVQYLSFNFMF